MRAQRSNEVLVEDAKTSEPAPRTDQAPKTRREGSGPGGFSWKTIALVALGIYALLLIILNSKSVSVDFVFVSQKTRVIFLVLLSVALGALIMWLVPRTGKRRKERPSPSGSEQAASRPGEGRGREGWNWKAIILAALGIYALLLIILNAKTVSVNFVFFSQKTRVIFLVLLSMALGALLVWLVPRMRHGRKEKAVSASRDDASASTADIGTGSG
jgi:uncharacterized integral membrane protein